MAFFVSTIILSSLVSFTDDFDVIQSSAKSIFFVIFKSSLFNLISKSTSRLEPTTLLALLSIFFFGGEILKGFSLAMIFGVVFGTYSSIYIANTVLVRLRVSQKTILRDEDKN